MLLPFGIIIGLQSERRRALLLALAHVTLIFTLYSSYLIWSAGLNWGPRFLVALMPALTLLIVPLFDRLLERGPAWARLLTATLLLLSIVTQLLASTFKPDFEGQINETLFNLFLVTPPQGLISNHPHTPPT